MAESGPKNLLQPLEIEAGGGPIVPHRRYVQCNHITIIVIARPWALRHLRNMTHPGFEFAARIRVRYSEIDGQKVVFNSRYLEYADVALSEYWRWLDLAELPDWAGMEFHVARATVDFKAPFRYGDEIDAWVRTERIGNSSLTSRVELCHADTGALHTVIELIYVNVDLNTGTASPVPAAIRARMLPG